MSETKSSLAERFLHHPRRPTSPASGSVWPGGRWNASESSEEPCLPSLLTWLPLFVLSFVQGEAYGTKIRIPFLRDLAVNVRFLIAAPILILAESVIDHRWRKLVLQFLKSEIGG